MIVESKGIKTDRYFIPPFQLRDGEIVVIDLYGGAHYHEVKRELTDIFTGKTRNDNVHILQPLTFVEQFKEPIWRRLLYPVTVEEYLKKNANSENSFATKIYDLGCISKKTNVHTLDRNLRKLLCLYSTVSKTRYIVFDVDGQDPQGAIEVYTVVKNIVKNGASAILIDWTDEMKYDCTKFIAIEWNEHIHTTSPIP